MNNSLLKPPMSGERLQKVLAAVGLGSRRQCEQLILDGRVEIDKQVVSELGVRVDIQRQEIRVDGSTVRPSKRRYFVVNKPRGVLSTNNDPEGRPRVIDLVDCHDRLFTVGRLDKSSEGLIVVTNDGPMANDLMHPRYQVPRTYEVQVAGAPSAEALKNLRQGIHLAEGPVRVAGIRIKRRQKNSTILQMVLTEGKNREIRRMAARIGHKVMSLRRVALGPLKLADLPPGAHRELTHSEVKELREFTSHSIRPGKRKAKGQRRSLSRTVGRHRSDARKPNSRSARTKSNVVKGKPKRNTKSVRRTSNKARKGGH